MMIDRDVEFIMNLASSFANSEPNLVIRERVLKSLDKANQVLLWPAERLNPEPLIGGEDLRSLGFEPSPMYAKVLQGARDAQLDQQLCTKEEATTWAIRQFQQR